MNRIIILIFVLALTSSAANNKYKPVADKIINNLKTQRYYEMGINDTIIDINKDGLMDTVKFDGSDRSYKVNDSIYFGLHNYNGLTVLEKINETFYIYDVWVTNSELDNYTCRVVFEIQEDFSTKKVIEFKNTNSFYITNNDSITPNELKFKYLVEDKLLECLPTERGLNDENAYFYGFNGNSTDASKWANQIDSEIILGLDTIICMAMHTADRSPYSTTYMRLHSTDTNRFKYLNSKLAEWKEMSQMKAYYKHGILVIYEHGWEDINEPYRLFVIDLNNEGVAEIKHFYQFDYKVERTPYFDPEKFIYEEEDY